MQTIGERIKFLRKKRRLSQRNLALRLNITNSTISRIENGDFVPNAKTLQLLADFFNVSTDYILTGNQDQNALSQQYPEKYNRIFSYISLLKDEDVELVESVVLKLLEKDNINYEELYKSKASNK